MSTILNTSFCALLLLIFSCGNKNPTDETSAQNMRGDTLTTQSEYAEINTKDSLLDSLELNIISSLTINQKTDYFESGVPLTKYLKFELISKAYFDSRKSTAVNFLNADTIPDKKKNGITVLKCRDKTVHFIDKPDAEDAMQIFTYAGEIAFLDKFLIGGSYWESGDYKFIDKTSGEVSNTFVDYPYISPDKKHIICINPNGYDVTADLELYEITSKKVTIKMRASFKNWLPSLENQEIFWSSDGYLYLIVHNAKTYWKDNGHLNEQYQYIRIKIL